MADNPDLDKYITEREKNYIKEQIKEFVQPTRNVSTCNSLIHVIHDALKEQENNGQSSFL